MNLLNFKWDDRFSRTYFENGIQGKVSLYENYRWMPEITFPMACQLREMYPDSKILDFGCAKGFLVYALRLMGIEAFGFDVSKYAIKNCISEIRQYLYCPNNFRDLPKIDVIFAKDTFEHISYNRISDVLNFLSQLCRKAFFIVPFGDNGKYRIFAYEKDVTHIIAEDEIWWNEQFINAGFKIIGFSYGFKNFKENWTKFKDGNGFYILETENL